MIERFRTALGALHDLHVTQGLTLCRDDCRACWAEAALAAAGCLDWDEEDSTPIECHDPERLPEHRLIATRRVQDGDIVSIYRRRESRWSRCGTRLGPI